MGSAAAIALGAASSQAAQPDFIVFAADRLPSASGEIYSPCFPAQAIWILRATRLRSRSAPVAVRSAALGRDRSDLQTHGTDPVRLTKDYDASGATL